MWSMGCPAGFCDRDAYGPQERDQRRYGTYTLARWDAGYAPGLACYEHGGPSKPIAAEAKASRGGESAAQEPKP